MRALFGILFSALLTFSAFAEGITEMGVGASPARISYVSNNSSLVAGTSTSYAAQSIGAECSGRATLVVVTYQGSTTLATVTLTVGGNSATQTGQVADANSGVAYTALFIVRPPAGTTATIVSTFSASMSSNSIFVYNACGVNSLTAVASASSTASPSALSALATQRDGFVLCGAGQTTTVTNGTFTYTSVTSSGAPLNQSSGGFFRYSDGSSAATTGANITPGVTYGGTITAGTERRRFICGTYR